MKKLTSLDYETYDLDYVTTVAKRFYDKGFKIYLDYHFSDYWVRVLHTYGLGNDTHADANLVENLQADPQKQWQPTAWPTTLTPLAFTLRNYVSETLQHLANAGIDTTIVSLGNEIRNGMLWPLGRVSVDVEPESARRSNFTGLATLYKAARNGVDDAVKAGVCKPQVMIHIDNGYNLTLQQRWFSALTGTGQVESSDWDVFGFSFYPFYGTNATLENLKTTVDWVASEYGKPIHVVETDWPAVCEGADAPELSEPAIPASVEGQLEWIGKVVDVVKQ